MYSQTTSAAATYTTCYPGGLTVANPTTWITAAHIPGHFVKWPRLSWDEFDGIEIIVGGNGAKDDTIVITKEQLAKAIFQMYPDLLSKFTAARLMTRQV